MMLLPHDGDKSSVEPGLFLAHIAALRRWQDAPNTSFERFNGSGLPDLPPEVSLRFPSFLAPSSGLLALQARADWRGVHPKLMRFAGHVMLLAARSGVPLYVRVVDPFTVRFLHAVFVSGLTPDEWAYLGSFCLRVAESQGIGVFELQDIGWRLAPSVRMSPGVLFGDAPVSVCPLALSRMG